MGHLLGVSPAQAIAVVLATVGMYIVMVIALRALESGRFAGASGYDLAAVIVLGPIVGRAALGESPRLAGGVIAVGTLLALQTLTTWLRRRGSGVRALAPHPVLLMAGSRVLEERLRAHGVTRAELESRLRVAGVRSLDEVALVVLEPNRELSVLRRGESVHPEILRGVLGVEDVPPDLIAAGPQGPAA